MITRSKLRDRKARMDWLRADENTNTEEHKHLVNCLRVAILTEVTPVQQTYLTDYIYNELSMPQIAEKYSVNKSTVSRELKYAKRNLERVLKYANPKLLKSWLKENGHTRLLQEEEE